MATEVAAYGLPLFCFNGKVKTFFYKAIFFSTTFTVLNLFNV